MATSLPVVVPVVVMFAFDNFKYVETKISAKCKHSVPATSAPVEREFFLREV